MDKAFLVLDDGKTFEGFSFGAPCEGGGEIVINTGVYGYENTLTNSCNQGKILIETFPMVGNYGVIPEDFTADVKIGGYVLREWCENPSNFRAEKTLDEYLKEKGIPGIYGVDTRAIFRYIRKNGIKSAKIQRSKANAD